MSDLDKKLDQLLRALVSDEWHDDGYLPSYKKAIKQAFKDAGYIKPLKLSKDRSWDLCVICSKSVSDNHTHEGDLMTGQEELDDE